MPDTTVTALAIVPLAVVFFVLSLIKTSLRSLSKVTLRRLSETASPSARAPLLEFLDNPTDFVLNLQSLIQVSLIAIAVLATTVIDRVSGSGLLPPLVLLAGFVLGFEHFFPRFVMSVDRESLVTRLLPAYAVVAPVARVIAWPMAVLYRSLFHARPGTSKTGEVSEEEIRAFIDVGEEAGILDQAEGEIVESIVDFSDTIVREVMTPRVDVVSIEASRTVAELRDLMVDSRHSRIPIYRDRVDNIEGVVHMKDMLEAWKEGKESEKVASWMKPVLFVPETKIVASMLKEFQRRRNTFAVVVDEFGGTSGVVTVEDLLEEIVGEIKEEDDEQAPEVVAEAGGSYLLSGKAGIGKLEELFGLDAGDADYDTIAGLVFSTLGRVPTPGERFVHEGLSFQVVDADRHRLNKVRVTRATPGEMLAEPRETGPI
jgi:CBS domain containing-hemolysin-like protein